MPDTTITIPSPVLTGSDYFKVRYRLIGGAWSAYQNETNTPFTLTGLSLGNYQLEIIVVDGDTSPPTECPPVYRTFIISDPFTCITFNAEIIQIGFQYVLRITFTQSSPPAAPNCGWEILYTINGQTTTVPYATLPNSGVIDITLPSNSDVALNIRGNLCNGNYQYCFSDDIPAIEPECIPMQITNTYITEVTGVGGGYYLNIDYINSIPATQFAQLVYYQTYPSVPIITNPEQGFIPSFPISPASTGTLTVKLNPTPHPQFLFEFIKYNGNILDACEHTHYFQVQHP